MNRRLLLNLEQLAHVAIVRMVGQPALGGGHFTHRLGRVQRPEGGLRKGAVKIGARAPVPFMPCHLHPRGGPLVARPGDPATGEGNPECAAPVLLAPDEEVFAVAVAVQAPYVEALRCVMQVEPLHVQEIGVCLPDSLPGREPVCPEPRPKSMRPGEPVVLRVAKLDPADHRQADGVHQNGACQIAHRQPAEWAGIGIGEAHLRLDPQP